MPIRGPRRQNCAGQFGQTDEEFFNWGELDQAPFLLTYNPGLVFFSSAWQG
jgi:hypothetical protein